MLPLIGAVLPVLGRILDKVIPDPAARDAAKAALLQAQSDNAFREIEVSLSAILSESQSEDPWTSRARPSFLYVVYIYILAAIPMGFLFAFQPEAATNVTEGVSLWLAAIPEEMWWLFGTGYLGYTAAREVGKGRKK